MKQEEPQPRIKARKRGNRAGILFFVVMTRIGGLRAAYGMLYFVCLHYLLFDREAVTAAMAYVKRMFPTAGFLKRRWKIYQIFISQGRNLIDRNAMLHGLPFQIQMAERPKFEKLASEPHGIILLTSHVGNWQIVMSALKKIDKLIYLVMRPEDNEAVQKAFKLDEENRNIRIISTDAPFGGVVDIMKALDAGDVVCIMGDRPYMFDTVTVDFLGEPALFPYSSFKLGALANVPVAVLLSAKTSTNSYVIEVPDVYYPKKEKRGGKQELWASYVQEYVEALTRFITKHPYQFFIFYDLWSPPEEAADEG